MSGELQIAPYSLEGDDNMYVLGPTLLDADGQQVFSLPNAKVMAEILNELRDSTDELAIHRGDGFAVVKMGVVTNECPRDLLLSA